MTTTPQAAALSFQTGEACQVVLPEVAKGGEGTIFKIASSADLVLKQYLPQVLVKNGTTLAPKIQAMIDNPPIDPTISQGHVSLAWPRKTVVDQQGLFAGYIMPLIDTGSSVELHMVSNPSDRKRGAKAPDWLTAFNWEYLLRSATNLASATQALHDVGYVIGDFNERNVLVRKNALVTLVDCDSMQVPSPFGEPFLCRVMRPEFTAPELLRRNLSVDARAQESDLFPLAVHVYQLLMEGRHPFAGVWHGTGDKPERHELAAKGLFVQKGDKTFVPQAGTPPFEILSDNVRALFLRAFVDGAKDPTSRPTAIEWYDALQAMASTLVTCSAEPFHRYAGHLKSGCPWCILDKGSQVAVGPRTVQVPLPPAVAVAPRPVQTLQPRSWTAPAPVSPQWAPAGQAWQQPAPGQWYPSAAGPRPVNTFWTPPIVRMIRWVRSRSPQPTGTYHRTPPPPKAPATGARRWLHYWPWALVAWAALLLVESIAPNSRSAADNVGNVFIALILLVVAGIVLKRRRKP